jgi:hypothetical protein
MGKTKRSRIPENQPQRIEEFDGRRSDDGNSMQEEIARRAYELYEEHGGTDGFDLQDWFQAEDELRSSSSDRRPANSVEGKNESNNKGDRTTALQDRELSDLLQQISD